MSHKLGIAARARRDNRHADCHRFKQLMGKTLIARVEHEYVRRFKVSHEYLMEYSSREYDAPFKVVLRDNLKKLFLLRTLANNEKSRFRIRPQYQRHRFNECVKSFPRHQPTDAYDKLAFELQNSPKHRPIAGKMGRFKHAIDGNDFFLRNSPCCNDRLEISAWHYNSFSARSGKILNSFKDTHKHPVLLLLLGKKI